MDKGGLIELDVKTINAVIELLDKEIQKYGTDSPESIALWKFKEQLNG